MAHIVSTSFLKFQRLFGFMFLAVFIGFSPLLVAQSKSQDKQSQDSYVLKRNVRRVILDVVVTDSDGRAVHGLTEKEFSVKEDNKKQKLLSFDAHDLTPTTDFVKVPPLPANTFINAPAEPERGPLYVLLLDLVNTRMDDEAYARQQLLKFIQQNQRARASPFSC